MGPLDLLAPEPAPRWGRPPERNAYVELHNLIAAAASTAEFGPEDRERIAERHGVDLGRRFLDERAALYERLLDDRLANGDLDDADRAALGHVARTLALSAADLRPAHRRAFGAAVEGAIADDCLDVEERLLLYKLQHTLGLDPRLADGAYDVLARERLLATVARALCDGQLSPDEAERIEGIRRDLSVEVPEGVAAMLARAAARWEVRHGSLPTVDVGVRLRDGEVGHYAVQDARWRTVDGGRLEAASPRHHEAVRSGRTERLRVPETVLFGRTDVGRAVVTDRRLVLVPEGGAPSEYGFASLVQTLRFENGTVVRTRGRRQVFIDTGEDNEVFYTVLYRAARLDERAAPD